MHNRNTIAKILAPLAFCVLCDGTDYTSFYGPQGQYRGSAATINGYTTFYGPQGQFEGAASTQNNYSTFYSPQGVYEGNAIGAE